MDAYRLPASAQARSRPLLIGLSGPIGCGKSTVAAMLGELGGRIVDADQLAREVTGPRSPALSDIRARFGDGVFDPSGELDRAALARLVFDDRAALADLERIVHPLVRERVEEALASAAVEHTPFVAVEAIKLVEGGLAERCDEVWLVQCGPRTQRERLRARGADALDVEQRIAAQGAGLVDRLADQLDRSAIRPRAVRRLSTEGSLDDTRAAVEDALADALEALLARD